MTKREAKREAKILRRKLKTKGWRIEIWENVGWYVAACRCGITITVSSSMIGPSSYWALFNETAHPHSGNILWSQGRVRHFSDPNRAAEHIVALARRAVSKLARLILNAEKALGQSKTKGLIGYQRQIEQVAGH